jgi:DNA-directed RNA polymerase subunit RPC12/RpoP
MIGGLGENGEIGEHLVRPEEYRCKRCGRDVGYRANLLVLDGVPDKLHCRHCGNKQVFLEGRDEVRRNLQRANGLNYHEARGRGVVYRRNESPSKFLCVGCRRTMPLRPRLLGPIFAPDRVQCPNCGQWQHFQYDMRPKWISFSALRFTLLAVPVLLLCLLTVIGVFKHGAGYVILASPCLLLLIPTIYYVLEYHLTEIDKQRHEERWALKEPSEYSWTSR